MARQRIASLDEVPEGARDLAPAIGHPALARHIGQALMADEFDMSFFQDKALDHGLFSPLSMLARRNDKGEWPAPIIPLVVGVLQFPIPSARRCYKLGKSLRRAIESYPEDLKVALVATGGLSHQVSGERRFALRCVCHHVLLDAQIDHAPFVRALYDGSTEAAIATEVTFEDGRKGNINAQVAIRDVGAPIVMEKAA